MEIDAHGADEIAPCLALGPSENVNEEGDSAKPITAAGTSDDAAEHDWHPRPERTVNPIAEGRFWRAAAMNGLFIS